MLLSYVVGYYCSGHNASAPVSPWHTIKHIQGGDISIRGLPSVAGKQIFCLVAGILLTAYSPLGSPDRPFGDKAKEPVLLQNPVMQKIAEKHNTTSALVNFPELACTLFFL